MSQSLRQSELFAGNDWTAIYRAFTEVNLNAYDFETIRSAMVTYIKQNYPEQYNDWVVQSEFIAILDLVAYMGHSLAFRMDLNARENFIDIARKRESILRLAKFLSYNPRRNIPASGILKVVGVKTTESIVDSTGIDLNNRKVVWEDPSNSNWYDQFITIMNSAFVSTNPFGTYLDQQTIAGVTSQLYRFDSVYNNSGQYSFSSTVSNTTMNFELLNMKMDSNLGYVEVEPNPITKFQLCYLNDGNGYSSNRTGFFSLFKQGTLHHTDYNIPNPISNNTITIDTNNINDSDVWVQSVNDNGYLTTDGSWTKVGYVPNDDLLKVIVSTDNITYNNTLRTTQRVYQVATLDNDQIMIKFGDGNYGKIPTGNIRIWFRVSNGLSYYIRPDEIQNINIDIPYYDTSGKVQTLTLYYSLMDTIVNASETQSNDEIRNIAGSVYSTQGRMVSGSDYNTLPKTVGNGLKIKATNRFYSGQSKFIDINDPTGQYQNTITFADDGALYSEYSEEYTSVISKTITDSEIVYNYVIDKISTTGLYNFILNEWLSNKSYPFSYSSPSLIWKMSSQKNYSTTGLFVDSNGNIIPVGPTINTANPEFNINDGALLKFSYNGIITWATVDSLNGNGTEYYKNSKEGPIRLNKTIQSGSQLLMVLPNFPRSFSITDITNIENYLGRKNSFGIGFSYSSMGFYFIDTSTINLSGDYDYSTKGTASDSSWIIKFEYTPSGWKILTRSLEYIFESVKSVKFFFINDTSIVNPSTGNSDIDTISVLKYNSNSFKNDINFYIDSNYSYTDGYIEPKRVKLKYQTNNVDGSPDNPESFLSILNMSGNVDYVFHKKYVDDNGYETWILTDDVVVAPNTGSVIYTPGTNINNGTFVSTDDNYDITDYIVNYGNKDVSFKWKHLAGINQRIDPAVSNIIDVFVLTNGYYNEMLSWRETNYSLTSIPNAPTEIDLELEFSSIEDYKMFSDEIIWRPAKFKFIGGSNADADMQFKILAVPLPGTKYSNGEIKANILSAINTYFDVSSWDFGETFYASELIGYLHQQLLNSISSVVLVPNGSDQKFGNLFQIPANNDELFFPTLTVDDIEIITSLTNTNLRIE